MIYPIGSIYFSINPVNPNILFGGEWIAWGGGRVPLGIGSNGETNYTSAEQVGGSENSNALHTHTAGSHTHTMAPNGNSTITTIGTGQSPVTTGLFNITNMSKNKWGGSTAGAYSTLTLNAHDHEIDPAPSIFISNNGIYGGNRQPYITCYMWKRIS